MPASVPSSYPKEEASWGRERKTGHQQKAGGWSSEITTPSEDAKGGEPGNKGAGCKLTHVTTGNDGSSTSTTKADHNPTRMSGCCPNGWGREVNSRDGQKPIEEQPPQSQTNEILQRGWMNPFEKHGPDWRSEWHPKGITAGSGRSEEKGVAGDGNGERKPAFLQLGPPPKRELERPKKTWNPYGKEGREAWLSNTKGSPAGAGRIEPMPPVPQAPKNLLPQHAAVRAPAVQESRDVPITGKAKDAVPCAAHDESDPAAIQGEPCAATKRSTPMKIDDLSIAHMLQCARRRFRRAAMCP